MKRIGLIHPILFAAFPVLFLYAQNAYKMDFADVVPPLLLSCLAATVLTMLLSLVLRSFYKGGLVTTAVAILFYSYGRFIDILPSFYFQIGQSTIGPNGLILPLWCLLLSGAVWLVARTRKDLHRTTKIMTQLGLFLVAVQIVHIGYVNLSLEEVSDRSQDISTEDSGPEERRPDIYFIVMDAYGRADILQEIYGVDNSEFISFLEDRGFQVARNSFSNYPQTLLSLAATLNLDYVQRLDNLDPESENLKKLATRLWDNRVFRRLKKQGYTIVAFERTGSSYTESMKADVFIPVTGSYSEFESILLATTPLPLFLTGGVSENSAHRRLVLSKLEKLPHITEVKSPKFVFAHVFSPRKPFVFGPGGEAVEYGKLKNARNSVDFRRRYIRCYAGQVVYISKLLKQTIAEILDAYGDTPPIIIVQGDHGPRSGMDWLDVRRTNLKEIFSILNAVYLPDIDRQVFYDSISPVNTFRIIFKEYFNGDFELLPDKSYYSKAARPYDFQLVEKSQLVHIRSTFDYLLENDFDSLPTLDRMILYEKEMTDRALVDCYAGGEPLMTFAGGTLEMADCRLIPLENNYYLFEAVFIPHSFAGGVYELELRFFEGNAVDSSAMQGFRFFYKKKFATIPSLDEMTDGKPTHTVHIFYLESLPAKYTISVLELEEDTGYLRLNDDTEELLLTPQLTNN